MGLNRYLILLFIFVSCSVSAQTVQGVVTDMETGKPLLLADVANRNTAQITHTDANGNYTLFARLGDTLVYSAIGYKPVQRIRYKAATEVINVPMATLSYQYNDFTYKFNSFTKYTADSAERASTYQRPLAHTHPNALGSPASALAEAFSKKAKETYHFQKVFETTELQKFIDTRYTPELVTLMTKLTGDSVGYFMYANPMPYDYCRTASDLEIKMWIRNQYKSWISK